MGKDNWEVLTKGNSHVDKVNITSYSYTKLH